MRTCSNQSLFFFLIQNQSFIKYGKPLDGTGLKKKTRNQNFMIWNEMRPWDVDLFRMIENNKFPFNN